MRKLALILLCVASPVVAEDPGPALRGNIELGRVFLTPAERAILDQRRQQPERETAPARQDRGPRDQSVVKGGGRGAAPIGYIKSASGEPMKWQNGDFVPLADGEPLPGLALTRLGIVSSLPATTPASADTAEADEDADDRNDKSDTGDR